MTVAAGEGYTATLDHADGVYEEGETVTVSITVTAVGMTVGEVKAGDAVATVGVEDNGTYTATFVLGTEDTEVTITLKAKEYSIGNPTLLGENTYSKVEAVTLSVEDQTKVAYGTTVTVNIALVGGYSIPSGDDIKNGLLIYVNGELHTATPDESSLDTSGWTPGYTRATSTFTMPAENVEIEVLFNSVTVAGEGSTNGLSVQFVENEYVRLYGFKEGVSYTELSLYYTVEAGYKIDHWEYSNDNGETWETYNGFYSGSHEGYLSSYSGLGSGLLMFRAVGEYVGSAKINYVNGENVVLADGSSLPEEATIGETVTLNYMGINGYSIIGVATVEGVAADDILYNEDNWGAYLLSFVMPETEVTITFSVGENGELSYTPDEHIASVEFRDSNYDGNVITTAAPGDYVYAFVTPVEGWTLVSGSVNGGEPISAKKYGEDQTYVVFNMPSDGSDAVLTFTLGQMHSLSATTSEDYSVTFEVDYSDVTEAATGQTVDFTIRPASTFVTPTKATVNGEEVEFEKSDYGNSYSGSFTMPDRDVVLDVEYDKVEGHAMTAELDQENKSLIEAFKVTGRTSKTSIGFDDYTPEALNGEFTVGETLTISFSTYISDTLAPELYLIKGTAEEKLEATEVYMYSGWGGEAATIDYTFDDLVLTEDMTGFAVRFVEKTATTATLTAKDEGGADMTLEGLTFTRNDSTDYATIDELNAALKVGDILTINLPEAPENRDYSVTVKMDGTAVSPISKDNYYVTGPVEIEVTRFVSYALTLNNGSGSSVSMTASYEGNSYYNSFKGLEIGKELTLTFRSYYLGGDTYTVTVTNGDEAPQTINIADTTSHTITLTVAGSVTVDIVAD